MAQPEALAFDMYGTLVDPIAISEQLEGCLAEEAPRVALVWRQKQLEYTFRLTLSWLLQNPAPCRSRLREHGAGVRIRSFGIRYNTRYLSRKGNRSMNDHEIFELGDVVLQQGATLRDAKLAYKTYGTLNDGKSNAIVYPTWYSGRHWENEWLIGEGMALDPTEYFIIVPNMLGNGLSSSPSNTAPPYDKARFPRVTVYDNVSAQHRLVTEHFDIEKLVLVTGWSMGAGQTYQWAVSHPEMVPCILPFCGSAKTSPHNVVFLEGVKAALTADAAWNHGWYDEQPTRGLRAMARVYAGWGFSQAFYWNEVYREVGYSSLEDFLVGFWEGFFLDNRDANNLLCMLWTWQNGDISKISDFDGDYDNALASIQAKAIVMPAEKDLYFPPEDEEYAVRRMPNAELRVIPGVWGHFAGGGINPVDTKFIDDALKELLAS